MFAPKLRWKNSHLGNTKRSNLIFTDNLSLSMCWDTIVNMSCVCHVWGGGCISNVWGIVCITIEMHVWRCVGTCKDQNCLSEYVWQVMWYAYFWLNNCWGVCLMSGCVVHVHFKYLFMCWVAMLKAAHFNTKAKPA